MAMNMAACRTDNAADSTSGLSGGTSELTDKVSELATEYFTAKDAAKQSIDSQVKLFDDLDTSAKVSIDNVIESMQKQIDYLANYNKNLKLAMEKGVDEGLIQTLSDGSEESAAILAGIVQGSDEDIAKLNETFLGVEKGKNEFSDTIADMETDFREKMKQIKKDNRDMVDDLNHETQAKIAGADTIGGYIDGIESKFPELKRTMRDAGKLSVATMREELGMHSPSKVMEAAGDDTMLGYIAGIEKQKSPATDAMRDIAAAVKAAAAMNLDPTAAAGISARISLPDFDSEPGLRAIDAIPISQAQENAVQHVNVTGSVDVRGINSEDQLVGITQLLADQLSQDARRRANGISFTAR